MFSTMLRMTHEQLPLLSQNAGFQGFQLLTDRQSGKAMSISFWDTREHLNQVEERAAPVRSQLASSFGTEISSVEIFEVEVLTGPARV